jgi:Protein of unknown function (DUF2934)
MNSSPSNEHIQARAYELYLEHGSRDGRDVEDWLAAEEELKHRHAEVEAIFEQEKPEPKKVGYAAVASSRRR